MSIKLGLYDFFTNIIPGLLYLWVINEIGKLFGVTLIELENSMDVAQITLTIIVAFIVGHVMNLISFPWYRFFIRKHDGEVALEKISKLYPDLKFSFRPDDLGLCRTILRSNDEKQSEHIESLHVNAMLARNISLGLFMLGLIKVIAFLMNGIVLEMFIGIGSFILCAMAILRARDFYRWFYREVFLGTIKYGFSVKQIVKLLQLKEREK